MPPWIAERLGDAPRLFQGALSTGSHSLVSKVHRHRVQERCQLCTGIWQFHLLRPQG